MAFHKPGMRPFVSVFLLGVVMFLAIAYLRSPGALERHRIAAALLFAALICLGFAIAGVTSGVVSALRPGGGLPATLPIAKEKDPLKFWINIFIYVAISVAFLIWAGRTIV